mmetsp:Transcript_38568/g.52275  ORF Transcript_38568/g.52275 Transcript_38568/m.52275 type:complete len:139 (-) Transcript_38568:276-692(-)
MKGISGCIFSGLLAAIASTCGKLAFDEEAELMKWIETILHSILDYGVYVMLALRLLLFLAMLGCNTIMLSFFLRSLHTCGSLVATVVNFAANFIMSGICGFFIFGERHGKLWWGGSALILFGVALLTRSRAQSVQHKD